MSAAMMRLLAAQTRSRLLSPHFLKRPLAVKLSTTSCLQVNDRDHCPDYYAVLGIGKTATQVQVKVAYFKQAKKFHPDQNRSEEARLMFELVAEAYEVLSDERKRKNFDEFGTPGIRFGGTTAGAGGPGRARGPDNYDPEELYDKIFGEASRGGEEVPQMEYEDYARSHSGTDSTKEFRISIVRALSFYRQTNFGLCTVNVCFI